MNRKTRISEKTNRVRYGTNQCLNILQQWLHEKSKARLLKNYKLYALM
jgi:hypothetical protein